MNASVSFKIAKLLKQAGYNNESAYYYDVKGESHFDINFPSLQPTKPDVYYDMPTLMDVVLWFFEKEKIWICVSLVPHQEDIKFEYSIQSPIGSLFQGNMFDSLDDAYEDAILFCLRYREALLHVMNPRKINKDKL